MGSSAREPAASSSVRCREGPPFSRPRGTNPESAKIASRPFPSPLLRSLSFFPSSSSSPFFFKPLPAPLPTHCLPPLPPTPACSPRVQKLGRGARRRRRLGGGKVATRKFRPTNTPTPSAPVPAPLGQKLCGRPRRADPGRAAGVGAPAWDWRAPRPRAPGRSSEPERLRGGFFSVFIYIFILSLSLPPPLRTPVHAFLQTTLATPLHARFHTPAPGTLGEGRRCLSGFGARGASGSLGKLCKSAPPECEEEEAAADGI